jgi:hypothetical protein
MESIQYIRNEVKKLPDVNESTCSLYKYKYDELLQKYDREYLNYVFYNEKKYIYEETNDKETRKDAKFRKEVRKRYKSCIVTGKSVRICEVAHIVPFNKCLDEISKYDPDNGLLLCRELHNLFDTESNDFKIDPDTQCIEFAKEILQDDGFRDYHQYNGNPLKIKLDHNTVKYLKKKYNN